MDIALENFQDQQKSLFKSFQMKNGLGKNIEDLKKEMNKLTESKVILKKHIDARISALLLKENTKGVSNYANPAIR